MIKGVSYMFKKKLTRREFLKYSGATGAALAASSALGPVARVFAKDRIKVPIGDPNHFGGMKLNYVQDTNWMYAPLFVSPHIEKEAGVSVGKDTVEYFKIGEGFSKIVPQLMSRKPKWDWIQFSPMFLGSFVSMGALEPLDPYLEKYAGTEEYLDQVMPAYREFYMKWDGKVYGVMLDGDIHLLHYRPSFFNDPELKKKFEKRFKRELKPPETWYEYRDAAQFFTEELKDKGIYGVEWVVNNPLFGWGFYYDMIASKGVNYFDENMNPTIVNDDAVEALELFKEINQFAPPGHETMGIDETITYWQSGRVVMAVWWIDLTEFTAQAKPEIADDQASALVPGWKIGDKVVHRAMTLYNRIASIPKNLPPERKEAAFYFIYRLSHQDYSTYYVADEYSGSDPFMKLHYVSPEQYLLPDPLRGTSDLWPTNSGIFHKLSTAENHLKAGYENVKVGYPQFNWSGAVEYAQSMSINFSKFISGQLTAKQALEKTADEWVKIVQKYGLENQKKQYANFVAGAKKLGYWK